MIDSVINEIFNNYYKNIDDIELIILKLKEHGLSQMQSTKILISKLEFSLKEADNLIVSSKAWSDNYNSLLEFRKGFFDSATKNNISKQDDDISI